MQSLTARAILAVTLMVGFYILALGIVAILLAIPWLEFKSGQGIHVKLAIICLLGAGMILWSIVPRIDRFIAPGLPLRSGDYPRLFETLGQISKSTGQRMPDEVYLVGDMNAWVAERGGMMGLGSRRIMGLGLPLMDRLTLGEFRAVLSHEFGHYHGGDTRLGPFIYKTRSALGRTINLLEKHSSFLQKPFLWYGTMFLRVTHGISRAQEFSADRLAASLEGPRALIEGLKKVHSLAPAYDSYWRSEVGPVLNSGRIPPILAGFHLFTEVPTVNEAVKRHLEDALVSDTTDPFDTHPTLPDRIAAVASLQETSAKPDHGASTLSLLGRRAEELEAEFIHSLARASNPPGEAAFQPIAWTDVGAQVLVPQWIEAAQETGSALADGRLRDIPALLSDLPGLAERIMEPRTAELSPAERQQLSPEIQETGSRMGLFAIATNLALCLHRAGWVISAPPGAEVSMSKGPFTVKPFKLINDLRAGSLSSETWSQECVRMGIGDLPLISAQA